MNEPVMSLADMLPIQTSRLKIRLLKPEDAPSLAVMTNDPRITRIVHFLPEVFTDEDARRLIEGDGTGRDNFLGAYFTEHENPVALIGVHLHHNGETEIGYWVKADLHGQGIATEAVSAVIAALSTTFPGRLLVAECNPVNIPSWQLLKKLGFRETGLPGNRPGRMRLEFNRADESSLGVR